jgi:predicted enzyme related to lactoylglutathione lyase
VIDARRVDFIGVPVQDLARADAFYGGTLGLRRNPNSGERWVEYDTGNVTIALISPEAMGPDFQVKPHSMPIALGVDDVEEARAKLETAGVEFGRDTIDSSVSHIAGFADPDGNAFILYRRYAPFADGSTP